MQGKAKRLDRVVWVSRGQMVEVSANDSSYYGRFLTGQPCRPGRDGRRLEGVTGTWDEAVDLLGSSHDEEFPMEPYDKGAEYSVLVWDESAGIVRRVSEKQIIVIDECDDGYPPVTTKAD